MSRYGMTRALARTTLTIGFAASLCASLQGCFLALAGAAGGTALVATDRRTVGSQTEDREIQVKALADLGKQLPDSAHVNVAVFNQRVLLTGEVPDEAPHLRVLGGVRGGGVRQHQARHLVRVAHGEQVDPQPRHGMPDQDVGPRLAGRGQQGLQVPGALKAVARPRAGI